MRLAAQIIVGFSSMKTLLMQLNFRIFSRQNREEVDANYSEANVENSENLTFPDSTSSTEATSTSSTEKASTTTETTTEYDLPKKPKIRIDKMKQLNQPPDLPCPYNSSDLVGLRNDLRFQNWDI